MSLPPRILVNGRSARSVSVLDRGLMYGDGVFRTLRVEHGRPLWWEAQIAKLTADAGRLGIPCPSPALWEEDANRLLAASPASAVLKLILTRGPGVRGYRPPALPKPTRLAMLGPLSAQPDPAVEAGAHVHLCVLRLSDQPRLAGIKHLNRLEHVLARTEWDDPAIHEGLLLDSKGRVVCGVSSNVFIYRRGSLMTPRLNRCGIAGVARDRLLGRAARLKLDVRETDISLDDLMAADEVMLTNSLI